MVYSYNNYKFNASLIKERIGDFVPEVLMILGSGLGFIGDMMENPVIVNYTENDRVYETFAEGHKGRFLFGRLKGRNVVIMQGRLHFYEGYTMEDAACAVRTMRLLGADKLILTNAAGCLHREWNVGDVMLIKDHIKMVDSSPLIGHNVEEFGARFCDMTYTYDPEYQELARRKAAETNITLREGTYMFMAGPQYETPAEIRAIGILGGDAVGMSTVPEAITAHHCGMRILGLSMMTNYAAGITEKKLSGKDVTDSAERGGREFSRLLLACLEGM